MNDPKLMAHICNGMSIEHTRLRANLEENPYLSDRAIEHADEKMELLAETMDAIEKHIGFLVCCELFGDSIDRISF